MPPNDPDFSTLVLVAYETATASYRNVTLIASEQLYASSLLSNGTASLPGGRLVQVQRGSLCASALGALSPAGALQPLSSPFVDKTFFPIFPMTASESIAQHDFVMWIDWMAAPPLPSTMPIFTAMDVICFNITWVEYSNHSAASVIDMPRWGGEGARGE